MCNVSQVFVQGKGPSKIFVLRAEGGELVGFIAGGPPLGITKDAFDEETIEVYAFHVLPAYSHFAEFHKLLWRAFSLWAQRVAWKSKDEGSTKEEPNKKYKKAVCMLYEYHPAVTRFFCKHPIMKLSSDHPELDSNKEACLPHRCYTWDLMQVKRIEPWELAQTEHQTCMRQFVEKSGMVTLLKILTEQSGYDPLLNFSSIIKSQMEDFGSKVWMSSELVQLTDPELPREYIDFGNKESYWNEVTQCNIQPLVCSATSIPSPHPFFSCFFTSLLLRIVIFVVILPPSASNRILLQTKVCCRHRSCSVCPTQPARLLIFCCRPPQLNILIASPTYPFMTKDRVVGLEQITPNHQEYRFPSPN